MSSNEYTTTGGSLGALAGAFVLESLQEIIVPVIAVSVLVFFDLITGLLRSLKHNIEIRFSRACRETMTKFLIYFTAIVCASMMQIALHRNIDLNLYTCYFILFVEGTSIVSNVLDWHGMSLNFNKVVSVFLKKKLELEDEDVRDIVIVQKRDSKGRFAKSKKAK